jgi:hypothetical protein
MEEARQQRVSDTIFLADGSRNCRYQNGLLALIDARRCDLVAAVSRINSQSLVELSIGGRLK